ncbi:BZ3500_MvSof-1268-A1-R1_Chr3-1g05708 [Microbotryum saponariae]|uniref:BZ3500_MvSof-1268-A1-R1_Chr3-1g05708 protein n=1 Tax=Microbotryum saponariae TaxID=289078 RepID=A0A2X0L270_9BASI|nr:BZ3500_MvSof-1268-A1-R1_Chr3-1g05708 [Microbotryum saponariae]SDA04898.1 BZ3501_MvSof-1269-A2-R1_Chr3-1g05378 [Microbotryum saponariae]
MWRNEQAEPRAPPEHRELARATSDPERPSDSLVTAQTNNMGIFDLESQFTFYGSYHTNKINVLIHIVCVPMILFTALILTHGLSNHTFFRFQVPLPAQLGFGKEIDVRATFPFLYAAGNALYFTILEPVAGMLYAPVLLTMGHMSNVLYDTRSDAMQKATVVFVASWIAQFIGHGKFEGRAPALFNSLFQSLVLAVFFVWLELLFFLGYRPELHKKLQNSIGRSVLAYRQSLKKGN